MIVLLLIVSGLIFGSFVNALVWRLHRQEELHLELDSLDSTTSSKAKAAARRKQLQKELKDVSMTDGRSMCSSCRHPLAPKDLVPLFSWLWLRGKCRYCRRPIQDPPLVELLLPLLFVVSYIWWPLPLQTTYGVVSLGFWLVFLVGFAALSLYDLRWYLLPDKIVWPLVGLAVVQVAVHAALSSQPGDVLSEAVWGVAIASGVFFVLYQIAERLKRQWIGFGDVKLGLVLGLIVGGPLKAILLLYIASLAGLLASLPFIVSKRLSRGSLIPYGPFLMLACVVVVLAGPQLTALINRLIWGL